MAVLRGLVVVGLILATQAGDGGCAPTTKACDLDFAGLSIQDGRVVDTVTAVCDLRPTRHVLQVWIEYKRFDEFDSYDRTSTTWDIPGSGKDEQDPADQPVRVSVSSPCLEGTYRTRAHVEGKGPVTDTTPKPIPFEFEDTGWQKHFSARACAGGD